MLLIVRNRSFWTPGSLSETGEWVGRKALGSRVAENMWDRKMALGLGLSLCPGGPVIVLLLGPGPPITG